jgi:hypothetical protein
MKIELPFNVGDTVYVITYCEHIYMFHDNNYLTGTGVIECPFENTCDFEECDDTNIRIFETTVSSIYNEGNGWCVSFKNLAVEYNISELGKKFFLSSELRDAERILNELKGNKIILTREQAKQAEGA